ncbi:MAG: PepSY-associated TM helix domain-containing protein [Pseudomonadota bacterium]
MKEGFRQTMAWLHTWLGLVVGWILFYVYLTGTLGYLDKEIDYWMAPDRPFFSEIPAPREQLALAQTRLNAVAPDALTWNIQLIGGREAPWLDIRWTEKPKADATRAVTVRESLHPQTGEPLTNTVRATGGGQLLYRMHYSLAYMPLDTAILIVMTCTMFMFTGMITGIIAHKKIFKDFFTFRPGKGQRSWLDAHNLLSVTSLPFHLIVTYSGLLFFVYTFLPDVQELVFRPKPGLSVEQQVYQGPYGVAGSNIAIASGTAAPLADLSLTINEADAIWGLNKVTSVEVRNPGDANARVILKPRPGDTVVVPDYGLLFDGVSGQMLESFRDPYPFGPVDQVLKGVHRGVFAGPFLRFLYLFMGVAGTAMIAAGLMLWSNKRKSKMLARNEQPHFGIQLVDTLNLGTIVGLPIAIAAYFWANRLLPVDMETRAAWEVHAMYLTLGAVFLYPVSRQLEKAWVELAWVAAAVIGLLPLVNALTTNRHLGVSITQGDWVMAGFDLAALLIGIIFALCALRLQRRGVDIVQSENSTQHNVAEIGAT